ncbi:peptidoglycan hydrolase-like protein with peptidoglycan-binding domain [Nocardioides aromaticivorans]|uniref:Peptidoglycan hydrolase-like protein with peptidoglycan-binding domain n=2 Tax=Nocardioides aromaticivorans TaxID=200618 RepID=A0A7Z0CL96_9ACTN|nr:L,D-transpeptidase family protein [Nocardioides aromaticivorans]NYI45556.1 peptidoglycan hydrolase-like protein with peptidoglycan-binding domain [Nocardioides aromaticivorans]
MNTKARIARRITLLTVIAAVCSVMAYGVGWAVRGESLPWEDSHPAAAQQRDDQPVAMPHEDGTATPSDDPSDDTSDDPSATPSDEPDPSEEPDPTKEPEPSKEPGPPPAGPALLSPGDKGPEVRDLQARLKQIDWFSGDVTDNYGDVTTEAVRGFQAKRGFQVTGEVDQRTLDRLHEMTRQPTKAELTNQPPPGDGGNTPGPLDARCTTGRVLCIDKSSRTLRWVVDGDVRKTVDVRFGSAELPTREGVFSIQRKSRDHVSTIYHTSMPFAMFFSGGQAVHYSPDFAARGYNGASHGCVNVRDHDAVAWLYDQVNVGDKVVIYWS